MEGFRLRVPIEVRLRDLDSFDHVNNAVYFTYCEVARLHYWRSLFGPRREAPVKFIIVRQEIDYRGQATEETDLLVGIRVAAIGRSSFEFEYRMEDRRSSLLIAEARSTQAIYDYERQVTLPMPPDVRDRIIGFEGEGRVRQRVGPA